MNKEENKKAQIPMQLELDFMLVRTITERICNPGEVKIYVGLNMFISNLSNSFVDYASDNTRNRITGVYYYEDYTTGLEDFHNATFYDYDVHGNVKEIINLNNDQDLVAVSVGNDQTKKKVEYEYDLVSGNVKHVFYQKDRADQFIHEYEYDADNRITNVRTSKDNIIWEQDAKYFYYDHGPLARTEIGDKKVHSTDYAYTIQGWLKGVNSEELDASTDQGKDSQSGMNRMNGKDVFGYSLHYFDGDYDARHGNDFLSLSGSALPHVHDKNLFNGNIKEMYTASTNTAEEYIGTSHTWYNYDQLNRIKAMDQERLYDGGSPESRYASTYSYDANGNLKTLTRHAWNSTTKVAIDNFTYHYNDTDPDPGLHNNQLYYVEDGLGASVLGDDLADQAPYEGVHEFYDGIHNYDYDQIGQLIQDKQEDIIDIQWKVTGKVHKIIRKPGSSKSNLEFVYDAMGNRIMKIETNEANGYLIQKTYYIRDAQGNVMSIYTLIPEEVEETPNYYDLRLTERDIYGSSRLGTENINGVIASTISLNINFKPDSLKVIGDRRYELSNHLGNVLQVVTDRKLAIETTIGSGILDYYTADVVSQSDYYPFGMVYSNTDFYVDLVTGEDVAIVSDNDYRYSFQGQEKDDEIKGENNSVNYKYRMHDPRVGRFFAVDPLARNYPWNSAYVFSENKVLDHIELEGLEGIGIGKWRYVFISGEFRTQTNTKWLERKAKREKKKASQNEPDSPPPADDQEKTIIGVVTYDIVETTIESVDDIYIPIESLEAGIDKIKRWDVNFEEGFKYKVRFQPRSNADQLQIETSDGQVILNTGFIRSGLINPDRYFEYSIPKGVEGDAVITVTKRIESLSGYRGEFVGEAKHKKKTVKTTTVTETFYSDGTSDTNEAPTVESSEKVGLLRRDKEKTRIKNKSKK